MWQSHRVRRRRAHAATARASPANTHSVSLYPGTLAAEIFPRHYQRCEGRLERDKAKGVEWAVNADDGPYEGHCDGGIYSRDSCPHAAKIPPTSQALFCVYSYFLFLTKDIGAAPLYIGWLLQQLRRRFRRCWNLAFSP